MQNMRCNGNSQLLDALPSTIISCCWSSFPARCVMWSGKRRERKLVRYSAEQSHHNHRQAEHTASQEHWIMHHIQCKMHEKCAVQSKRKKETRTRMANWLSAELEDVSVSCFVLFFVWLLQHHRSIISENYTRTRLSGLLSQLCSDFFAYHNLSWISSSFPIRFVSVVLLTLLNTHSVHHRWVINFFFVRFLQHIIENKNYCWKDAEKNSKTRITSGVECWLEFDENLQVANKMTGRTRTLSNIADSFHSTVLLQIVSN